VKLKRLLAGGVILLLWLAAFSLLILFLVLDVSAGSPIVRIEWMRVLPGVTIVIMLTMFAAASSVIANRVITYKEARKETLQFMTVQAQFQKGNLEQAIRIAEGFPNSHLAKVTIAGLQEFRTYQQLYGSSGEEIEASKRALEKAEAIVHTELKRGMSTLATIGSVSPFVGLLGVVVGITSAFRGISSQAPTGVSYVASGVSEALIAAAVGLLVAIPAIGMYQYLNNQVETFDLEMKKSTEATLEFLSRPTRGDA
jgi:biopolymer transport protein ExbB